MLFPLPLFYFHFRRYIFIFIFSCRFYSSPYISHACTKFIFHDDDKDVFFALFSLSFSLCVLYSVSFNAAFPHENRNRMEGGWLVIGINLVFARMEIIITITYNSGRSNTAHIHFVFPLTVLLVGCSIHRELHKRCEFSYFHIRYGVGFFLIRQHHISYISWIFRDILLISNMYEYCFEFAIIEKVYLVIVCCAAACVCVLPVMLTIFLFFVLFFCENNVELRRMVK